MADNNNSFININDDPQKIDQYEKAFTKLKESIDSLSKPFNTLSNNIDSINRSLSKYNDALAKTIDKNKELGKAGEDTSNKTSDLISSFSTWIGIINAVKAGLTGLETALTGGLAAITVFAPEIAKYVTSWLNGKDAIDKAKLSLNNLNNALGSADYSNAVQQINTLKINIGLARKGLLDKKEVLEQYNSSVGKTMGQVNSLNEVEQKITKNGLSYIKMTMLKASAQLALQDAAKKTYEAQQDARKSDDDVLTGWDKTVDFLKRLRGTMLNPMMGGMDVEADLDKIEKGKQRRTELVKEATNQKKILLKIALDFQTDAANIAKNSGFDFFSGEMGNPDRNNKKRNKRPAEIAIEAKSITFAQQIELDKQHYDTEQALLQTQLDKKLISQEEFNKQSEALQQQYHLALGDKVKTFNKTDLDNVKKHMQDIVDANKLQGDIEKDKHNIKKAILPGDKLKAEQQLIADKYNYEIVLAAGNAEKIKQLEEKKQQDLTTLNKKYEQERKEFALQTAQKVSDAAFGILKGSIQSQADAKIKGLETQKQTELANTNLTAGQKKAIEDKYKKQEAEEKVKAFKAEQRASILQAVINGALAITKATAQSGVLSPFVIPGIIAETAIQVATIAKQKAPQYAKGGLHYQSDGRGALLSGYSHTDDTNAYLRSGEAVVVSEAIRNPWARNLVSAINVAYGGRDFSITNPGRGYAIGGIYTDGGNANRYYNQPMNDVKDLANTVAYQMINNFPPIYVDVKDVNNQQNILAQTVNRVNL